MKRTALTAKVASLAIVWALLIPFTFAVSDWGKTYGGAGNDVAYAVVQTVEGGYALAGATSSFGEGGKDFWLIKTNEQGEELWNHTYGKAGDESASSIVQTSDGGYALTGYTNSYRNGSEEFWLVKTDAYGNEQWNKTYGGTDSQAYSLLQTVDDGFVVAGATIVGSGSSKYGAMLLVKTDSAGNMLWNKTYGWAAAAYDLIATNDGGFALAGVASSGTYGINYFLLVKTDLAGTMLWNKTFNQTKYIVDYSHTSLVQTSDGGFAIAGSNIPDGFLLLKTDTEGKLLWERVWLQGLATEANSLIQASSGELVVAGESTDYSPNSNDRQVCILKAVSNGDFAGLETYGGGGLDGANSIIQTADGNYAIAGYTESKGEGQQDMWLIKTKPEVISRPPLPSASPTPVPTPYPWTTGPGSWAESTPIQPKFYGTLGATVVDGKIYFMGSNLNAVYDPQTENWTEKTPSPAFIYGNNAAVTNCEGKIYVMGGQATQIYDPVTDTWENGTRMPTERYGIDLAVIGGKIYVIGGAKPAPYGVTAVSEANEVYDPQTDSWTTMAPLPFPVTGYASAVLGGKIYIVGGYAGDPYQFALSRVQIYDPQTDSWKNGTDLQEPVTGAAAAVTSGVMAPKRIYLVGGNIMNAGWFVRFSDHMQVFDPQTGNWTFGVQMPTGRSNPAFVNVNDVLYALGGTNISISVSVPNSPTMEQWQAAWDTIASAEVHSVEKFTPFGYGLSSTPSPRPTTTLSPSPTIPEFPTWIAVFLILGSAVITIFSVRRRKTA